MYILTNQQWRTLRETLGVRISLPSEHIPALLFLPISLHKIMVANSESEENVLELPPCRRSKMHFFPASILFERWGCKCWMTTP